MSSILFKISQICIQTACKSLDDLRRHHYIAKEQAAYLRTSKETLSAESMVILMDFAKNYSFIVQDAVQGQHWNNSQVTLHPFRVYFKDAGELKCLSICVVSDHLQHKHECCSCILGESIVSSEKELQCQSHLVFNRWRSKSVQKLQESRKPLLS